MKVIGQTSHSYDYVNVLAPFCGQYGLGIGELDLGKKPTFANGRGKNRIIFEQIASSFVFRFPCFIYIAVVLVDPNQGFGTHKSMVDVQKDSLSPQELTLSL